MKTLLAWLKTHLDLVTGAAVGLAGAGLVLLGNPRNSGICASCFAENVAGALRLHGDPRMSYLRPELPGFLVGATLAALAGRGFQSRSGSAPLVRFFLGAFLIVGSAVFLGCPIKVVLRLAGGDLTRVCRSRRARRRRLGRRAFSEKGVLSREIDAHRGARGVGSPGGDGAAGRGLRSRARGVHRRPGRRRARARPAARLAGDRPGRRRARPALEVLRQRFAAELLFDAQRAAARRAGCCCSSPRSASISPPDSFTRGSPISRARIWTGAGRRPGCFSSAWQPSSSAAARFASW